MAKFESRNGCWYYDDKPFFVSSPRATCRWYLDHNDLSVLDEAKKLGFTAVPLRCQAIDLWDGQKWNYEKWEPYIAKLQELGLKTDLMVDVGASSMPKQWAMDYGWKVVTEEGETIFLGKARIEDIIDWNYNDPRLDQVKEGSIVSDSYVLENMPVLEPSFLAKVEEYVKQLILHFKDLDGLIYYIIFGERWAFKPYYKAGVGMMEVGYDELVRKAFREWLQKRFSLSTLRQRWGAPAYRDWEMVEPPIRYKPNSDFAGNPIEKISAAQWDWHRFKFELMRDYFQRAIGWVKEIDPGRPTVMEFNYGMPGYYDGWNREERPNNYPAIDHLGIQQFEETYDRNMYYIAISRGATPPPHQLNEIAGNPTGYFMFCEDEGSPMKKDPVAYLRRTAWIAQAMGGTGLNPWNLKGGSLGILDDNGNPTVCYDEYRRLNQQFATLGDRLSASRPFPPQIGILILDESTFHKPGGALELSRRILYHLEEQGYGFESAIITEKHIEEGTIAGYSLVFAPDIPYITSDHAEGLENYVKAGGNLVLFPGAGQGDELGQILGRTCPPLERCAGIEARPLDRPEYGTHDMMFIKTLGTINKGANLRGDYLEKLLIKDSNVEVLATYGWQTALPVITRNRYGKGTCVYLGMRPGLTEWVFPSLVKSLVLEAGLKPMVEIEGKEGEVFVGLRERDDGYLLILIEVADRSHYLAMRFNAERLGLSGQWLVSDCFGDQKTTISAQTVWGFETALKAAEVKVFDLVRKDNLEHRRQKCLSQQ